MTDIALLSGVMDRLVPPIDNLPGAGAMGLAPEVDALARRHGPYERALDVFLGKLAPHWSAGLPRRSRMRCCETSRRRTARPSPPSLSSCISLTTATRGHSRGWAGGLGRCSRWAFRWRRSIRMFWRPPASASHSGGRPDQAGQSQAAPRTPLESPNFGGRSRVTISSGSEKTYCFHSSGTRV